MRPSANLAWLFTEVAFTERFAAAAAAGFPAVEMPWPPISAEQVRDRCAEQELASVLVNLPVGPPGTDFAFGWACRPDHVDTFRTGFHQALAYAETTSTRFIHILAGLSPLDFEHDETHATYRGNIEWALTQLSPDGPTLLVEAINRRDNPRFLLSGLGEAAELVRSVGHPQFRLLFDTFHCQISEGTVAAKYAEVADITGHIQLGDGPDRSTPGRGTIDFALFYRTLAELGWDGFIGGEYRPSGSTLESLGWLRQLPE
jgi:hydroxypyruvate isomerase